MEVSALKYSGGAGLHGRSPLLRLQSDERLVALVRRGNTGAFEVLVARYQARLLAFCRHLLGSREDAEDVLQEAFASAYNAMLGDDRPINVRPWLYRIARNRCLNHMRRQQPIGVDSMDVHLSEHGTSTADKVHQREEFRLLVGDITGLPETQRTALVLREMDALSYEQIAEAMETTVPSVKSLLVRARVSLAEAAQSRALTCEQVRTELAEIAEGLQRKPSASVRRHVKGCDRCSGFQKQLKHNNKALAALLPLGPLAIVKQLLAVHAGHSAGTGIAAGASAASGAAGSGAAGAAAGATAAAGTAAAGTGTGGLITAGVGALATKAAAGLATAAIVTAGAVAVDNGGHHKPTETARALAAHALSIGVSQAVDNQVLAAPVSAPVPKEHVKPHLFPLSSLSHTAHTAKHVAHAASAAMHKAPRSSGGSQAPAGSTPAAATASQQTQKTPAAKRRTTTSPSAGAGATTGATAPLAGAGATPAVTAPPVTAPATATSTAASAPASTPAAASTPPTDPAPTPTDSTAGTAPAGASGGVSVAQGQTVTPMQLSSTSAAATTPTAETATGTSTATTGTTATTSTTATTGTTATGTAATTPAVSTTSTTGTTTATMPTSTDPADTTSTDSTTPASTATDPADTTSTTSSTDTTSTTTATTPTDPTATTPATNPTDTVGTTTPVASTTPSSTTAPATSTAPSSTTVPSGAAPVPQS
jgi:RNA polymerase sigma factor (sigma-70 family)